MDGTVGTDCEFCEYGLPHAHYDTSIGPLGAITYDSYVAAVLPLMKELRAIRKLLEPRVWSEGPR